LHKVRESLAPRLTPTAPLTVCYSHHLASPHHADIGQSGANLAAAGGDVALSTTSYVHGFNAATGAGQGLAGQK